jgi:hypothetical protein
VRKILYVIAWRDEGPFRVAFALHVSALPPPAKGKEWQRIDSFSSAEDVMIDPGFKISVQEGNR